MRELGAGIYQAPRGRGKPPDSRALPPGRLICPQLSTRSAAALSPAGGAPGAPPTAQAVSGGAAGQPTRGARAREQAATRPASRHFAPFIILAILGRSAPRKAAAQGRLFGVRSPGPPQRVKLQRPRTGPAAAARTRPGPLRLQGTEHYRRPQRRAPPDGATATEQPSGAAAAATAAASDRGAGQADGAPTPTPRKRAAVERDGCQACYRGAAGPRLRRRSGGAGAAAAAGGRFLHFRSAG